MSLLPRKFTSLLLQLFVVIKFHYIITNKLNDFLDIVSFCMQLLLKFGVDEDENTRCLKNFSDYVAFGVLHRNSKIKIMNFFAVYSVKGASKLYFMHYSYVVIILFNTVFLYISLHFPLILLKNWFFVFLCSVFFACSVLNSMSPL